VFAARFGDAESITMLIDRLETLPTDVVDAALSILGHHRSSSLVEAAIVRLSHRALSPGDRVGIAHGAVTGMTSLFEMDWFQGGRIKPALPHPGLPMFRTFLEAWGTMTDYTHWESLRLDQALTSIGSEAALARLPGRIDAALSAADFDQDRAHDIGHALRVLGDRYAIPDLALLVRVCQGCRYNGASVAVQLIGSLGTRAAFDNLLEIHRAAHDWMLKGVALDALETLSARLGLRVRRVGDLLEVASD
jgi:hypothetical protein